MPQEKKAGFIFLLYWSFHANFTVSTPPRFVDTLRNFTEREINRFFNVIVDHTEGSNLLKELSGIQIRIGDGCLCRNVSFEEAYITCDIPSTLTSNSSFFGTEIKIEVFIGRTWNPIGNITLGPPDDVATDIPTNFNLILWTVSAVILVCLIIVGFTCFKCIKKKSSRSAHPAEEINLGYIREVIRDEFSISAETAFAVPDESSWNRFVDSKILALLEDKNLLIPKSCLDIGEEVGAGQFGFVFEGFLQRPGELENVKVAIKTPRENSWSDPRTVESFLKEGLIMKDFNHPHVLGLLGMYFHGEGPAIVLPFMENGDLCSFLRDDTKVLRVSDLLKFAVDIASGMNYLATKKFVHRDLAARNCILDSSLRVKVADFRLSRDVYKDDYYHCEDIRAKLPCKWMAPESLVRQVYSTKTDVWSYGVLLWELMTRGRVPYVHLANCEVLEYIQLGHRLRQPEHCPDDLYMVMLTCWNKHSKNRPDFFELHEFLGRLRQKLLKRKQNKAMYENVPAQHTVYYNTRELDPGMDKIQLLGTQIVQTASITAKNKGYYNSREIRLGPDGFNMDSSEESHDSENEYLDMSKEPSV